MLKGLLYYETDFELARTHDPLWNDAQKQMVNTGKMHGYMRMYWAKDVKRNLMLISTSGNGLSDQIQNFYLRNQFEFLNETSLSLAG